LLKIEHDVPLAPLTTLGLGGPAAHFAAVQTSDALIEAITWAEARGVPARIIGGGSNVVIADAGLEDLVIHPRTRGLAIARTGPVATVRVAAGEPWDDVVAATTAAGLSGIECLSGIPGLAGATPIQNVGAYGQEISQVLRSVRAYDTEHKRVVELSAADCGLQYRSSAMRRDPSRWVVLDVTLELQVDGTPQIRYGELARSLEGEAVTPARVRESVLRLRRAKSMVLDPRDPNRRSAGSFFTNPVVASERSDAVEVAARKRGLLETRELPRWAQPDGQVKLAAGWLIEAAGFNKGDRRGAVGISSAHALALVHHGGGTTRELLALAREIRDGVRDTFGIVLAPEPVLLGVDWS